MRIFSQFLLPSSAFLAALNFITLTVAHAGEYFFERDSRVDLGELAREAKPRTFFTRVGRDLRTDASAILARGVSAPTLLARALEFDRYREWKMPNVRRCQIVARSNHPEVVWCEMSSMGVGSFHYLRVEVVPLGNEADPLRPLGIRWTLVTDEIQEDWKHPNRPAFERLDGSWYMEPQSDGTTYVRYFIASKLTASVPGFLIDLLVKRELEGGVRDVIRTLDRVSRNAATD